MSGEKPPPITRIAIVNALRFTVLIEVTYQQTEKKFIVNLFPDSIENLLRIRAHKLEPGNNYIFPCEPDDSYELVTNNLPREFNAWTEPTIIAKGLDQGRRAHLYIMTELDEDIKFLISPENSHLN